MWFKGKKITVILVIIAFISGCASSYIYTFVSELLGDEPVSITQEQRKFEEIYDTINHNFLWDIDQNDLINAAYSAMVGALGDPYSAYMTREEHEEFIASLSGELTGIGILFEQSSDGQFKVLNVFPESPASISGMLPGDIITAVDGIEYDNSDEAASKIRGEEGTSVSITCKRGEEEHIFDITRQKLEVPSVYTSVDSDNVGYIQIVSFDLNTSQQFEAKLDEMHGLGVENIIIDVRNNSGGYFDQAVLIADMLLDACTITHTEDSLGNRETYNAEDGNAEFNYVLLMNEYSASASEVLAAAIKENSSGRTVGTTTFGKGIVQELITLEDGSLLKLTTSQFLTPNGDQIHEIGITPDFVVEADLESGIDVQLREAKEILMY